MRFNKRNWKAIFLCFLAATVFWFFNALNKNYSANISLPIRFQYNQESYTPTTPLPDEVRINVTGMGWDLFRRSLGFNRDILNIPLERPGDVKKIYGGALPVILASQMSELEINYVLTDTLYLAIEPVTERKIPIRVDTVESYINPEYGLAGPVIVTPDSAIVRGPEPVVKELPAALEISLGSRNVNAPFQDEVRVPETNPLLTIFPETVVVRFDVAPFVLVQDTIPLRVVSVPVRVHTRVELPTVRATFKMLESRRETFSGDSIVAELDLRNIPPGRTKVYPEIVGLPRDVQLVSMDSVTIEF